LLSPSNPKRAKPSIKLSTDNRASSGAAAAAARANEALSKRLL